MIKKDWLRFWASGLIWSTSFLWIKIAVSEVSPLVLVDFRASFAALGMLLIILLTRSQRIPWQRLRRWLGFYALLGFINVAVPFVLISWGEQYISSGIASVLNSTTPLFAVMLTTFLLPEDRLNLAKLIGLLVGFAGVVVLFLPELKGGVVLDVLSMAAVLVASLFYAISGILIKRKGQNLPSEYQVLLQFTFAAIITWALTLLFERPVHLPQLPLTWAALLWLGLLGSSLASLFYFQLIHSAGPTRATMVTYIPPLVGLILGAIILGEALSWWTLVGGAMILAGIIAVSRPIR